MPRKLANLISIVFNPLLMPTLVFILVLKYSPIAIAFPIVRLQWYFIAIIFIFTFLIPLVSIFTLGIVSIQNYNFEDRQKRVVPFTFVSIFYLLITIFFFVKVDVESAVSIILGAITLSVILSTGITFFWKISMHSVGSCGVVGILLGLSYNFPEGNLLIPIILAIMCAGLVISARLRLNSHTPKETLGGGLVGFATCFLMVYFLL